MWNVGREIAMCRGWSNNTYTYAYGECSPLNASPHSTKMRREGNIVRSIILKSSISANDLRNHRVQRGTRASAEPQQVCGDAFVWTTQFFCSRSGDWRQLSVLDQCIFADLYAPLLQCHDVNWAHLHRAMKYLRANSVKCHCYCKVLLYTEASVSLLMQ